jgi:hypothetical protein
VGSQIDLKDGREVGQGLPLSEAGTTDVVTDGTEDGDDLPSLCFWSLRLELSLIRIPVFY